MGRDATRAMDDRPVLFISYAGVLGGAERVLLDCATRLERPVVVACPEGPLAAAVRQSGLAVEPIPNRSLRMRGARINAAAALAGLARDARSAARRHSPAAVAAWGARAVLACVPLPRVVAVHHDLLGGAAGAAVRAATSRAAATVAASHAIAKRFRGHVTVLHPGVDLAHFAPAPPPPGPPRALILGALTRWKRVDLAIDVAALVPDLRLTIAGAPLPGEDGRLVDALRRRAAVLGERVEFAGPLADPRPALTAAHALLHCADAEPYGMVLLEALACGRPVVAPAAAGPLEIVDGASGRLYPPGDAAAAARALTELIADPTACAAARRRAEAFPVEASSKRFADVVERVAAS
jgi:glycosyltransferase involved in cell wall biosynthesis